MFEIRHYLTSARKDPFFEWYSQIKDVRARIAVDRRINRMELGNFGDHKHLQDGVCELRIDLGPGFRVYYALDGARIVLLLCGGVKKRQQADIELACVYWRDWQKRKTR